MTAVPTSKPRRLLAAPAALAAFLLLGCSLGHNMKTVETAPKGEHRTTAGFAIWFPEGDAFYEDPAGIVQTNPPSNVVPGPLLHVRYGIVDNVEAGLSLDGILWPGVGGKLRLNGWSALDANVKLVWAENLDPQPQFDAALIFGNAAHSSGLKLLSHGAMPGSIRRGDPDAVLFYGFKHGVFFPEVAFLTRHREISVGVGFVF
jgi:hypothetical protein